MTSSAMTTVGTSLQSKPCIQPRGPRPNKVMIIGEAPGEHEEKLGIPFVGSSGRELDRMLAEAGWNPGSLYMTNVFKTRPTNNKLETLLVSSQEWKQNFEKQVTSTIPPIRVDSRVMYLHPNFYPELETLQQEIQEVNPNLVLALGNTALWALTGRGNISQVRGTTLLSTTLASQRKILPTYHPAAVLRSWDLRTIVVADLAKAKVQAEYPELRRPRRQILVNPTLQDIRDFLVQLSRPGTEIKSLAVDVETRLGQITEIGFASSPTFAIVIPFIKGFKTNYWSQSDEVEALRLVLQILDHPCPKIFQNGLYDIQYIWRTWKRPPRNCLHDTMIRHHSLYSELQKGLGFLGSIYTEEPAWKMMRNKKDTQEKRDDE